MLRKQGFVGKSNRFEITQLLKSGLQGLHINVQLEHGMIHLGGDFEHFSCDVCAQGSKEVHRLCGHRTRG